MGELVVPVHVYWRFVCTVAPLHASACTVSQIREDSAGAVIIIVKTGDYLRIGSTCIFSFMGFLCHLSACACAMHAGALFRSAFRCLSLPSANTFLLL